MNILTIENLSDSDIKRFWSKVDIKGPNECWEWLAGKDCDGYGQFWLKGKGYRAHRVAWFLANGQISSGELVCHSCDNRSCKNEKHLFLGTHKDNIKDAVKKGRMASGDKNGSRTHPEKLNPACGEKNGSSQLKELNILSIRNRYSKGETQTSIAKGLGISQPQVSNIVNKKQWAHL